MYSGYTKTYTRPELKNQRFTKENMMSKHTKGPWEFGGDTPFIHDADGDIIAIMEFGLYETKEDTANAHLIAAAPELLAALERLTIYLKVQHGVASGYAEEVIAKAKGEQDVS